MGFWTATRGTWVYLASVLAGSHDLAQALSGAFVLFGVGPVTLLGCLRHRALGDPDLLRVKVSLDGVSSVVPTSSVALDLVQLPHPLLTNALPALLLAPLLGWGVR